MENVDEVHMLIQIWVLSSKIERYRLHEKRGYVVEYSLPTKLCSILSGE